MTGIITKMENNRNSEIEHVTMVLWMRFLPCWRKMKHVWLKCLIWKMERIKEMATSLQIARKECVPYFRPNFHYFVFSGKLFWCRVQLGTTPYAAFQQRILTCTSKLRKICFFVFYQRNKKSRVEEDSFLCFLLMDLSQASVVEEIIQNIESTGSPWSKLGATVG